MSNWSAFYDAVANEPPHETAVRALDAFADPGFAVDLGCGDGRDTTEMLRRGWRVLAIDAEPEAIERLRQRVSGDARLETQVARFEDAAWPAPDLLNAGFSLPFCLPEHFDDVWRKIADSLVPGARFSGQLFGLRDGWSHRLDMTFLARDAAEGLFGHFELERFDEVEVDGTTRLGRAKHWHVFHIVARCRGGAV